MARHWEDIRKEAIDAGMLDADRLAEGTRQLRDRVRAYRLAELRKAQATSQRTVAEMMGISQARVSKIENGDLSHTELGTLQAYVAALGGTLSVVADFGDETLRVS